MRIHNLELLMKNILKSALVVVSILTSSFSAFAGQIVQGCYVDINSRLYVVEGQMVEQYHGDLFCEKASEAMLYITRRKQGKEEVDALFGLRCRFARSVQAKQVAYNQEITVLKTTSGECVVMPK